MALALASVLLVVAVGEVWLRLRGFDQNANERFRFHPHYGWTLDPASDLLDEVNEQGFRFPPLPRERTPGRPRLLVLGDSFAQGSAYPWPETFPGRLAGAGIEVASLAVGGWGTGQQWLALRRDGLPLRPDAVVLQVFPFNDLCNNNRRQAFSCSSLDFHRPYFTPGRDGALVAGFLHPVRGRLRGWLVSFGWLELRLGWGFETRPGDLARDAPRRVGAMLNAWLPPEHQARPLQQGWRVTELLLRAIAELLAAREIPLLAVVIPYARGFDPGWVASMRARGLAVEPGYATERVEAVLADAGVPVISVRARILRDGLDPRAFFFPPATTARGDPHFSARGHELVAGWILAELARLRVIASPR